MPSTVNRVATASLYRLPRGAQRTVKVINRTGRNLPDFVHYRRHVDVPEEDRAIADRIRRDGFVVLPAFISRDRTSHLKQVMDREIDTGTRVRPITKLIRGYGHADHDADYDWRHIDVALKEPLSIDKAFIDFALEPRILSIANAYLRTYAAIYAFSAWHNPPNELQAMGSFNWHRDPEGPYLLKSFLYVNDIDEESTHFSFIGRSHRGAAQRWKTRHGMPDDEMERYLSRDQWVHLVGPAGTVVLADTNGFHKGMKGRKERYMLSTVYQIARTIGPMVDRSFVAEELSDAQRRALRFCRIT